MKDVLRFELTQEMTTTSDCRPTGDEMHANEAAKRAKQFPSAFQKMKTNKQMPNRQNDKPLKPNQNATQPLLAIQSAEVTSVSISPLVLILIFNCCAVIYCEFCVVYR
jgi:hypothetical protein